MGDAAAELAVSVRDLGVCLGGRWILRHLDLDVRAGEILALVGESGSGKTLLLRQIVGLSRPTEGRIEVLGEDLARSDPKRSHELRVRWGVLFQEGALFSALSVFDNVAFPLRELRKSGDRLDEETIRELVMLKLEMVGLEPDTAWKLPSELSGGMVKRAALARSMALEPELLFLDEPTAGLDPNAATELEELLKGFHRQLRLSALLITHDLWSLAAVSDRIAVVAEGRVVVTGSFDEVARFDHPFVERFFHGRRGQDILRRAT